MGNRWVWFRSMYFLETHLTQLISFLFFSLLSFFSSSDINIIGCFTICAAFEPTLTQQPSLLKLQLSASSDTDNTDFDMNDFDMDIVETKKDTASQQKSIRLFSFLLRYYLPFSHPFFFFFDNYCFYILCVILKNLNLSLRKWWNPCT